jgi:hypothetical protein
MKNIILATMLFSLTSCAQYWLKTDLKSENHYKIEVAGNGPADIKGARERALQAAKGLCPKGFKETGAIPYDNFKPRYELYVKCH